MNGLNRYKLHHVTLFSYDGPVSESYNELRLRPRHDDRQTCVSFRVTTQPASKAAAHVDYFGNWVHQFHILPEHRKLRVESEFVVLVHPPKQLEPGRITLPDLDAMKGELEEEHFDWLAPTRYCPRLPGLNDLIAEAERRSNGSVQSFAEQASRLVHEEFKYQPGATHVHSSVEDCLATRAGVCQDFSHLLLALLRQGGVPARYVSGYLVPKDALDAQCSMERLIGGQASHAWAQAFIPEIGWIGLDPTVGEFSEERHIYLAWGRDYGDVAPVRGVYKGHAGQNLSVDVLVRPALDDEGAELLQETAAVPPPRAEEDSEPQPQQQQQQQQ
jgi:transglutaminase-like putative cysteine protease